MTTGSRVLLIVVTIILGCVDIARASPQVNVSVSPNPFPAGSALNIGVSASWDQHYHGCPWSYVCWPASVEVSVSGSNGFSTSFSGSLYGNTAGYWNFFDATPGQQYVSYNVYVTVYYLDFEMGVWATDYGSGFGYAEPAPPEEEPEPVLEESWLTGDEGMYAGGPGGGPVRLWLTPYGDVVFGCRYGISSGPTIPVAITLTMTGPDGPRVVTRAGVGTAVAQIIYGSVYDNSPGEFECSGTYVAGTRTGVSRRLQARIARFWGAYVRQGYSYEAIYYQSSLSCTHAGMYNDRVMAQPAPGYPNINQPPEYLGDEGAKFISAEMPPHYVNFYIPRSSPGLCQAAQ